MAETSRPWQFGLGDGIGAAADGSYTDDQWDDIFEHIFAAGAANYGVLRGSLNQLIVAATAPASAQVTVATGTAMVKGKFYHNTTALTFPAAGFPAPAAAARYDRIVLRSDWATRTVRVTRIAGVEGAGVPALTQVDGVTWDMPLATVYLAFPWGGTIAAADITDDRQFIEPRQREFDAIVGGRPGDYSTVTAAMADGAKSIFVRSGTYNEPGNVTLTSGMWLCGEDADTAILDFGANQLLVNEAAANYADHVLLENLQFKSTNVNGSVQLQRSRYCIVRHCVWVSTYGLTMTDDCLEHIIADNWFDTITGGVGITFSGQAVPGASHVIRGNRCNLAAIHGRGTGDGTLITENVVISESAAIYIPANSDYPRIIGNVVTSTTFHGIYVIGDYAVVVGNTASSCDDNGIMINAYHATVTGNVCRGNGSDGIEVNTPNATVVGNQAVDNTGCGIYFTSNASSCICKGNMCEGNGDDGIACDGGKVIVGDNSCENNAGYGIDYSADRDIVLGNIALNNASGEIDNTGATNSIEDHNITV